jgi:O-antigen ligase
MTDRRSQRTATLLCAILAPAFYLPFLVNAGRQRFAEVYHATPVEASGLAVPEIAIALGVGVLGLVVVRLAVGDTIRAGGWYGFASYLGLWAYLIASVHWSTLSTEDAAVKTVELMVSAAIVVIAFASFNGERDLNYFAMGQVLFSLVLAIGALATVGGWTDGRIRAFGGGPNVFGRFMFLGFIALVHLRNSLNLPVLAKPFVAAGQVVFLGLLVLSGSRGSVVGGLIGAVAYYAISIRGAGGWRRILSSTGRRIAAAAVAAALLFATFSQLPSTAFQRYLLLAQGAGTSGEARFDMLTAAFALFRENPVWGVGLGAYRARTGYGYPHNWFAELLVEGGLIAFALGAVFVVIALRLCVRAPREGRGDAIAYVASLAVFSMAVAQISGDLFGNNAVFVYGVMLSKMGDW